MPQTAEAWRESFPQIPWDEPLPVTILDQQGRPLKLIACRFCIADFGLKAEDVIEGRDVVAAFYRPDDFIEHMATVHGG